MSEDVAALDLENLKRESFDRLREAAADKGRKTITLVCTDCGNRMRHEYETMDVALNLKLFDAINAEEHRHRQARKSAGAEVVSAAARTTLADLREMGDEELAERLERLRAERDEQAQ